MRRGGAYPPPWRLRNEPSSNEPDGKQGLWDRAGRRYPAHLPLVWVRDRETYRWGWHRIAWHLKDPEVPVFTYYRRSRFGPPEGRWDDAT